MYHSIKDPEWEALAAHFRIQSAVDLDFVIGQDFGLPVGTARQSPPEFRRRILAALLSYCLQLRSMDYALKRYVEVDQYEDEPQSVGDEASDFIKHKLEILEDELITLHQPEPTFGQFGAAFTLLKLPSTLDLARMLANRGVLLEILPILRLCLEMVSWAAVAFHLTNEDDITRLQAQKCISRLKSIYASGGRIYGYLSKISHWEYAIHSIFIGFERERTGVLKASVQYRAMSLALCLVIFDVSVEVIRHLYAEQAKQLISSIQGTWDRADERAIYRMDSAICDAANLTELDNIKSLLS